MLRLTGRNWASTARIQPGGSVIFMGFGTSGARGLGRVAQVFNMAGATPEVTAMAIVDFHGEAREIAKMASVGMVSKTVLVPEKFPTGAGQGFKHNINLPPTELRAVRMEVERIVRQLAQIEAARGGTTSVVIYLLAPWSGHLQATEIAIEQMRKRFPRRVHLGVMQLPARNEVDLVENLGLRPDYPECLGLDGFIALSASVGQKNDWALATSLVGLFTANRVDPGQDHGANPINSLCKAAQQYTGGWIGMSVGTSITTLIKKTGWDRWDVSEDSISTDAKDAMVLAISEIPPEALSRRMLTVMTIPMDSNHPKWRLGDGLRSEAQDEYEWEIEQDLPIASTTIWSSARVDPPADHESLVYAVSLFPSTREQTELAALIGDQPIPSAPSSRRQTARRARTA